MCGGVSVITRMIPDDMIAEHQLRVVTRALNADQEIPFLYRDTSPRLPVWIGQELRIIPWGSHNRRSRLPQTAWCRQESLETWTALEPEPVEILASYGFDKGIWYQVTEGMHGILVRDEHGCPHVYLLTRPASHYYKIMTRNERMPVFVGQGI